MAKSKAKVNPNRVAVLETNVGSPLIIRSNPTVKEVRRFIQENNRRYHAGEAGGPSGQPSVLVKSAAFHESELDINKDRGEEIDISDL